MFGVATGHLWYLMDGENGGQIGACSSWQNTRAQTLNFACFSFPLKAFFESPPIFRAFFCPVHGKYPNLDVKKNEDQ